MRALIQRVTRATVRTSSPNPEQIASIEKGLLILAAFEENDSALCIEQMVQKIKALRIFSDSSGKMNLAGPEIGAEYLIVSQFTLYADNRHGNRPSFSLAAPKDKAKQCYDHFVRAAECLMATNNNLVKHSSFGLMLQVELVNDGPVTIWLDSHEIL